MSLSRFDLRSKIAVNMLPGKNGEYVDPFVSSSGVVEVKRGFVGHLNLHLGRQMLQILGVTIPGRTNTSVYSPGLPINTYVLLNPWSGATTSFNDALTIIPDEQRAWGPEDVFVETVTDGTSNFGVKTFLVSGAVKELLCLPDEVPNIIFQIDPLKRNLHIAARDCETARAAALCVALEFPTGVFPESPVS